MLSPTWLFAAPAAMFVALAMAHLRSRRASRALQGAFTHIGNYWFILAGGLLTVRASAALLAAAGNLYGIREGYRRRSDWSTNVCQLGLARDDAGCGCSVCPLAGGGILAGCSAIGRRRVSSLY